MDNHTSLAFLLLASSVVFMVQNSHAMDFFSKKKSHAEVEVTVMNGRGDTEIRLLVTDQNFDVIAKGEVTPGKTLTWSAKIDPYNYNTENHTCHVFFPGEIEVGSFPVFDAEETYLGNGIGSYVEIIWLVNGEGAYEIHSGKLFRKFTWTSHG